MTGAVQIIGVSRLCFKHSSEQCTDDQNETEAQCKHEPGPLVAFKLDVKLPSMMPSKSSAHLQS